MILEFYQTVTTDEKEFRSEKQKTSPKVEQIG